MSFRFAWVRWEMALVIVGAGLHAQTSRPALSIDDLFSFTEIRSAKLAPDGHAAVIATSRPDWKHDRFRDDLWLWREGHDSLLPLAHSGHDSDPEWSPNGKYIAFLSGRPTSSSAAEENKTSEDAKPDGDKEIARVWVVSADGGEPFPLYTERLKTHTFAWDAGEPAILLSCLRRFRRLRKKQNVASGKT